MIRTFADKSTELLARGQRVQRFVAFERVARRKLRQLEIAGDLQDLRIPPGNHLEKGFGAFGSTTNIASAFVGRQRGPQMFR